jgi:hypothetical protein
MNKMVKESFIVRQTKDRDEKKYSENGIEKKTMIIMKGVDNDGIVSQVTFTGSPEAMARKFAGFAGGSSGDIDLTISTSTTQTSLPTQLVKASNKAKAKKSTAAKTQEELDDADFDSAVDLLTS